jgi:hypothetical protein
VPRKIDFVPVTHSARQDESGTSFQKGGTETTYDMVVVTSQLFFDEMIDHHQIDPHRRAYSLLMKDLCSLLWLISAHCYRIIEQLLPLPSPTTLKKNSSPWKKLLTRQLTHPDEMPDVIKQYFAILGFGAMRASSSGISGLPGESCFTFVLLPVKPGFPDQVLHLCPQATELIDDHVEEIHQFILTACRGLGIRIVASATDGDRHTQTAHENAFKSYENLLPAQELNKIARHFVDKMECWTVTDFIHAGVDVNFDDSEVSQKVEINH